MTTLVALILVAHVAFASSSGATTTDEQPAETPAGYHVVFGDEFDGSSLDTSRWKAYANTYGAANGEQQCNTPANATVADGTLVITAREETVTCADGSQRQYTSAFLGSRETGHYYPAFAKYEIRAKLPHGQGLWPAFWLRHSGGSKVQETDILEYFEAAEPGHARQSLHFPSAKPPTTVVEAFDFEDPVADTGGDFHTFAMELVPLDGERAKFVFSIDGRTTYEYVPSSFDWLHDADQNAIWDIVVNMAVGGKWTGDPASQLGYYPQVNRCASDEKPPPDNDPSSCTPVPGTRFQALPAEYIVDYIRVYQRNA